jgi:dTDP-4-amino-4,6-dideoxygalactose transaminase
MMIKYLDMQRRTQLHEEETRKAVERVMDSGWFLMGPELEAFEREYAHFISTRYCIGVGNGLDALTLIYRAYIEMGVMQPGDEVIVPANTYIASILAISENGLVPVLVEPRLDSLQIDDQIIEQYITSRTRSIMIVHLYGKCAYTQHVANICEKYGLKLVEDNAQAHGCRFEDRYTGALGDAAGHSFYPTKNLGAMGDGYYRLQSSPSVVAGQ